MKAQIVCLLLFILVVFVSSQNTVCPFDYVYHLGDGVTDIGNSVLIPPDGPVSPATRFPYGRTYPGSPNGRWSDGLIDFDFAAVDFGFPQITPYLSVKSSSSKGVIFSVARSPVLDRENFTSRGIDVPSYAISLRTQLDWFKRHLRSTCQTREACAKILADALVLLGDIEGNDIGYPLSQGKSLEEAKSYSLPATRTQLDVIRELIKMGARRLVVPGNGPVGCYPYVLTAMATDDPTAYDESGCLKSVNDLITSKNNDLQAGIKSILSEFPRVNISYGPYGDGFRQVFNETIASGGNPLKACCGIGGKYNYDSKRFCGSEGVPICSNPNEHFFWDGIHLTHKASLRVETILVQSFLESYGCFSHTSPQFIGSV